MNWEYPNPLMDLLFVQEHLANYCSMLERSLLPSYGQHDIEWCQQFTAHQFSLIGNKPITKTPLHKALYLTLMEVKHKTDCEQPLATINVMNRIAQFFGYGPLRSNTEVQGDSNLFPREVECARAIDEQPQPQRAQGGGRAGGSS
jgi:hypothetical protein